MTRSFSVHLAQINPIVGDIAGNVALIEAAWTAAGDADLVVTPELSICAYPVEDLVLKPAFQGAVRAAVEGLASRIKGGPALLVGAPWMDGENLRNAVILIDEGRIAAIRYKVELPNYGVFDEQRVFVPAAPAGPVTIRGVRVGILICEEMWHEDCAECLAETGAEILISVNASPFEVVKQGARLAHAVARVTETGLPLIYLNQVGGQDELVFDGASFALNADRSFACRLAAFETASVRLDYADAGNGFFAAPQGIAAELDPLATRYQAMMLGLRDYVTKNRFPGVILGLSGGIDSALSAAIAVDALGADKVHAVMMPSRYTAGESLSDAEETAKLLGIRYDVIAIEPMVNAFAGALAPAIAGRAADLTEENIQSRIRGVTLMALSNKFGSMVLTTGNKSEMSVGYATLYGDMCGGFNVLKDAYKMTVFALSVWRNAHHPANALGPKGPAMTANTISKPPSAELRPDQKDEDSLPPYPVLDAILEGLVEREESVSALIAQGFDADTVKRVEHLLYISEYKRRQAPPGVKLTTRNFGRDRRYPITNSFRDRS